MKKMSSIEEEEERERRRRSEGAFRRGGEWDD